MKIAITGARGIVSAAIDDCTIIIVMYFPLCNKKPPHFRRRFGSLN
jgi:hypothetical protein